MEKIKTLEILCGFNEEKKKPLHQGEPIDHTKYTTHCNDGRGSSCTFGIVFDRDYYCIYNMHVVYSNK